MDDELGSPMTLETGQTSSRFMLVSETFHFYKFSGFDDSAAKSQVLPGQKVASQKSLGIPPSAGRASRPTCVKVDMKKIEIVSLCI